MNTLSRRRTLTALLAVAAMPLALLGLVPSAHAAVVGHILLDPPTGNQGTLLDVDTLEPCPVGSAFVSAELRGAGINPDTGDNIMAGLTSIDPGNTPVNEHGGYHLALGSKFVDVFTLYNIAAPTGDYTLAVHCYDDSAVATDEMTGTVRFTPTGGSFNAGYVQLSDAVATSTSLTVDPADPVASGTPSTLTATVTPVDAVGAVQFRTGATNLGGPVAVVGGVATFDGPLPAGANSLTAQFVPTDSNAFGTSTSAARSYVVAGPTSISGTARVGGTLSCAATTGGTLAYSWFTNGVATGLTTSSVTVPASWLYASVTCALTSTKSVTSVTRTSAAVTVALGAELAHTVRPKVGGKAKVGKVLTCSPGSWSPAATSYRYQWFRGAKVLAGKSSAKYKAVRKDRGKLVTCEVTAASTGHASGVAKAPARKVK